MIQDFTKGNITKQLIQFAIPLVLGNLFQLTYNAVDSIVVGRFAGTDALAAVGTADPVMNLLILGITGLCIGSSVLMSSFFGAGDYGKLRQEMGLTLWLGGVLSLAVLAGGMVLSEQVLVLMNVPEDVLDMAVHYLRIIFIGMPFTCFYNIFAAALRSVGDSKTPIRFLTLASVLNALLDVVFVAGLKLGVAGAGLATDIAEGVSAVLCMIYVRRHVPILHLRRQDFRVEKELLGQTLRYGGVTALQQCSQPIGKLLIQGVINTLGVSTIAAFNAVGKIEDFALVPGRSISNAMMTFTAQNRGAKQEERIRAGFRKGIVLEFGYWGIICCALLLSGKYVTALFGEDEMMQAECLRYLGVMAFFYWLPGMTNAFQGFFRGNGRMNITLLGTLTQISFRVLFTCLLVPEMGITGVAFACILGWVMMLVLEIPYYKFTFS